MHLFHNFEIRFPDFDRNALILKMPVVEKVKELYLAKGLSELQTQAKVPATSNVLNLAKVSGKVLQNAENALEAGDQEKAYVLFFKYVELSNTIRKSKEYLKDKTYYDSMVSKKSLGIAIGHLETLTPLLEERYEDKNKAEQSEKLKKQSEVNKLKAEKAALTNGNHSNGVSLTNGDNFSHKIEPGELYRLVNEKATTFLLFDARPSQDYKASHIKHPSSINVPEGILTKAITVKSIERHLHVEDRGQWNRRNTIDKLIMFDWSSEDFEENTPLYSLKDALYHWDVAGGAQYKSSALILTGGFDNFALSYPTLVTNPQKSRPPTASSLKKLQKINIDNVEYPDLDAAFIATPSPGQSPALNSGAITVQNVESPKRNLQIQPRVPDRTTKPIRKSSVEPDFNISSTSSIGLNRGMINTSEDAEIIPTKAPDTPKIPVVDRSLKAKVLSKDLSTSSDVLEAEKDIVEESLRMENEEFKMETEWETLRLKRENAANEELRY